jgi:glucose-1-phosphate adenylyltransferase
MLRQHEQSGADITIASIPVNAEDAPGFGILKTDSNGLITEFCEKPDADQLEGKQSEVSKEMHVLGRHFLASMGIYIFSAGVLQELLKAHELEHDFGKQIIPSAMKTHRVASYAFEGYWSDIGTVKSFFDANLMLTGQKPEFDLYDPKMPIYTNARMLQPAKINSAEIDHAIIGEASVIGKSSIRNSIIGIRSFVGDNVVIEESILMGADYFRWHKSEDRETVEGPEFPGIGDGTVIKRAIIDRNVSIGKNCVITNAAGHDFKDGPDYHIRDGIVVIPKNASIPDGTII